MGTSETERQLQAENEKLWSALRHLNYRTHAHSPGGCSACEQIDLLLAGSGNSGEKKTKKGGG